MTYLQINFALPDYPALLVASIVDFLAIFVLKRHNVQWHVVHL